jgi:hypothetical protein
MGRVLRFNFLSPEQIASSYLKSPPHGILKGGFYGSKEKSQKESQKEKEVKFLDVELWQ